MPRRGSTTAAPPRTNQNRRRSNRRLRRQTNQREAIVFEHKATYDNSWTTANGVLVLSKRKRAGPTAEEKERKRQKQRETKIKQVAREVLYSKIIGIYENGINTEDWQFGPNQRPKIADYLQATYPIRFAKRSAATIVVHRSVTAQKKSAATPHLRPFRDRRGENRKSPITKNDSIIALCDEFLSESNATAPAVVKKLLLRGYKCSKFSVYTIAKNLFFKWTKPWYTDVLTSVQKLKRKIFCRELLRLTPEQLLNRIAGWLFTDEKWWDIVGPSKSRYIKALSQIEAKMENQVICMHFCLHYLFLICLFAFCCFVNIF